MSRAKKSLFVEAREAVVWISVYCTMMHCLMVVMEWVAPTPQRSIVSELVCPGGRQPVQAEMRRPKWKRLRTLGDIWPQCAQHVMLQKMRV